MQSNKFQAISLIELMITIAIVIILMAISINSMSSVKVENQRKEATSELIKLKSNIEQLALSGFVDNTPVKSIMEVATAISRTKIPSLKYYSFSITTTPATTGTLASYTLTATAIEPLKSQDTSCQTISLTVDTNNNETKGNPQCW